MEKFCTRRHDNKSGKITFNFQLSTFNLLLILLLLAPASTSAQRWPWGRQRDEVVIEPQEMEPDSMPTEAAQRDDPDPFEEALRRRDREPRRATDGVVDVALLLPLQGSQTTPGRAFLEFYQGARLAMEELGEQGIEVRLNLYDTRRNVEEVARITRDEAFRRSDLVIGPIYEEELSPVLEFADEQEVAVVSPLAQLRHSYTPLLYRLPPDPVTKYEKLRPVLSPDKRVVLVRSGADDAEFLHEVTPLMPLGFSELRYTRETPTPEIEELLRGRGEVVFVVTGSGEGAVDDFLARIGSLRRGLVARSVQVADIQIVGSARWQRFANIDRRLFFQLGVCYVTSYHADNSDARVRDFNKRYIVAFGSLPTPYSYRGYDAAKLFTATVASRDRLRFEEALNLSPQRLLQTPYRFEDQVNTEWALVKYRSDYTIRVE